MTDAKAARYQGLFPVVPTTFTENSPHSMFQERGPRGTGKRET